MDSSAGLAKRRNLIAAGLLAFSGCPAAEPLHSLALTPGRDFGLAIGATLSAEIRLALEPGFVLETAALPQPGAALNDDLELRGLAVSEEANPGETVYRLTLTYQVFKGVRGPETLTVPALPLRFSRGAETQEAQAPAWSFTLAPLIPPQTPDEAVVLRGDLPAPALPVGRHWPGLLACLAGLVGLGAWRLGLLRRRVPPFVQAARALKKLRKQPPGPELWRQGARQFHAALNQTAGRALLSAHLASFLAERPGYAPLAAELQAFFAASDRLFFGGAGECPAEFPLARLESLCRRLAAAGEGR